MKTINDLINNGYTFEYGWRKVEEVLFLDKEIELEVIFEAYFKEDEITVEQFNAYAHIKENLNNILKNDLNEITDYLMELSNNQNIKLDDVIELLNPVQIIISDSYVGIYCDSELDIDNGIAIKIVNDKIEAVGIGDIIL